MPEPTSNVPPETNIPAGPAAPSGAANPRPATSTITDVMGDMVNNPTLPVGGAITPALQVTNPNEFLNNLSPQTAAQATAYHAPSARAEAGQGTTTTQDISKFEAKEQAARADATYDAAAMGTQTPQGTAAQGQVDAKSTMKGQLTELMAGDVKNAAWAKGAVQAAEEAMAARGLGASSIAGEAITRAIMDAGIKVAEFDAMRYAEMDLTNLTNEQQMSVENIKMRHQSMLSDQAAVNAARQFNAQNKTQVGQFFANLISTIDKSNVEQANAMSQFNAAQKTQASIATAAHQQQSYINNAQTASEISKFNAEQANLTSRFYTENQLLIDQSNAEWRRGINTANTAATNTANQINALNTLEISNTAMNNIWMAARDNAAWAFQSGQNEQDRAANLAIAAFNRDTQFDLMSADQRNSFFESLGGFAFDILRNRLGTPRATA